MEDSRPSTSAEDGDKFEQIGEGCSQLYPQRTLFSKLSEPLDTLANKRFQKRAPLFRYVGSEGVRQNMGWISLDMFINLLEEETQMEEAAVIGIKSYFNVYLCFSYPLESFQSFLTTFKENSSLRK